MNGKQAYLSKPIASAIVAQQADVTQSIVYAGRMTLFRGPYAVVPAAAIGWVEERQSGRQPL
jgi:hypothetical protein